MLILKPLTLKDVDNVMSWVNDPDVIKNFQHFTEKFTRKEETEFVKKILKSKKDYVFSVFREDDGAYVGQCAINQISWENKLGRMSLIVKKEHWGSGYAQKILPLLLRFAFRKLKLHKVWGMAYATNRRALHIYSKLGFKKEGLLREEYFWHGKYHDMVRIGILADEFTKGGPK
ncbi:MAG: GNAT family N-acetyltransferase [Parcubacteria group bacterium]|nr:GNAT family N-acetyltransferase [Parcubacteria group bacterium]